MPRPSASTAAAQKPAYEALYHCLGDAAKKYSAVLAPVRKSAALHTTENQMFSAQHVRLDMQKLRNTLIPKFRGKNAPLADLSSGAYKINDMQLKHHGYNSWYAAPENKNTPESIKRLKDYKSKEYAFHKHAVKAAAAAAKEFKDCLDHYAKNDGVVLTDLPKTVQALQDKVLKYFSALEKKAAKAKAMCEKELAGVSKKARKATA